MLHWPRFTNRDEPGASANIGSEMVARAPADGYTILVTAPNFTTSEALFEKPGWRFEDFTPVIHLVRYANVLVPMNDVMDGLLKQNGPVNGTIEYLGKVDGKWLAFTSPLVSWIRRGFVPPLLWGPCEEIADGHASTNSDLHDFRIPPPETG